MAAFDVRPLYRLLYPHKALIDHSHQLSAILQLVVTKFPFDSRVLALTLKVEDFHLLKFPGLAHMYHLSKFRLYQFTYHHLCMLSHIDRHL